MQFKKCIKKIKEFTENNDCPSYLWVTVNTHVNYAVGR